MSARRCAMGQQMGRGRVRTAAMEQLRILLQAFDEGLITASEYKEHKQIVLCGVSQPAMPAEQAAASASQSCAEEPITIEAFDRAVERCMRSLLLLVHRLALACARHSRAEHTASVMASSRVGGDGTRELVRRHWPRQKGASCGLRGRASQTGATHPVGGSDQPRVFIFDKLGQPTHGGKSVQQRHQELDAIQARSRLPVAALPRARAPPPCRSPGQSRPAVVPLPSSIGDGQGGAHGCPRQLDARRQAHPRHVK